MDDFSYQRAIPRIHHLISMCKSANIPIFYTQAVREPSGIDLLTHIHKILPGSRIHIVNFFYSSLNLSNMKFYTLYRKVISILS
jgi:nicotinamidase-related amidase